jgi:hypothetical protein
MNKIQVPPKWGMLTSEGNRALSRKAKTVARKIEKLAASGEATPANVSQALVTYLGSWLRSQEHRTTHEAGDAAVRDCVGDFHDKLWNHVFGGNGDTMWDAHLAAAYRRRESEAK